MHKGRSVLVVEDDPLLRMDATLLFEEAGLSVVEMESADEALAYVFEQAGDIGAIFTDVRFRVMPTASTSPAPWRRTGLTSPCW